jgi:hypothetical protein
MTNRYDLCTGRKDKDGKSHWTKIGVMFPAREGDGFSIKLEALPLPNEKGEVWISVFVPRERDDNQDRREPQTRAPQRALGRGPIDISDEVPF